MRAFYIFPTFEMYGREDDQSSTTIGLIADLVADCLRRGGDTFQRAVVWADPGMKPGGTFREDIALPHVFDLSNDEALREWVRKSVDPNQVGGGDIRSMATCRCATFGYDGQAILCLRHEDDAPVSPDPSLVIVEERPDLITDCDWFDGWVRN